MLIQRQLVKGARRKPTITKPISRDQAMAVHGNMLEKDEERSAFDYERVSSMYSAFYAGLDPRRRTEMAEGGMVKEDKNAMANLSNTPVHMEYPRAGFYTSPYIDDSVEER